MLLKNGDFAGIMMSLVAGADINVVGDMVIIQTLKIKIQYTYTLFVE